MRHRAAGLGISFRPHLKTAKSLEAAAFVLGPSPGPATVSTLREAEVFGANGYTDLLYAVCVSPQKLSRITQLRQGGIDLKIILDSVEAAEFVSAHAKQSGDRLPVLIEIDVDDHRSGVRWDNREALIGIGRILTEGGAALHGVMCHAGESYNLHDAQSLADDGRGRAGKDSGGGPDVAGRRHGLPCRQRGRDPDSAFRPRL